MSLLAAMTILAEDWDDVLNRLEPGQARRLRDLVAQFVGERNPSASSNLAEAIVDVLVEELPVTHPVVTALLDEDRLDKGLPGAAADRAWSRLAGLLRERLEAAGPEARRGEAPHGQSRGIVGPPPGVISGNDADEAPAGNAYSGPPGPGIGDEDDD